MPRRIAFWSVYVVALLLLAEAALVAWHLARYREFFYSRKVDAGSIPVALQLPGAVFQPYYGYTLRPGRIEKFGNNQWRANNFGFPNLDLTSGKYCCDYPYSPAPGDFVVGILGGSVGSGYALQAQLDGSLARALSTLPELKDKRVIVLNFALPGFRQPQQLMTLAYFTTIGQHFDLIINIDGFNEVVTSWKNWSDKVEPSYPADTLWGAWGRQLEQYNVPVGERSFLLANYHRLAAQAARQEHRCGFAICSLFSLAETRYHNWRAAANEARVPADRKRQSYFPTRAMSHLPNNVDVFSYTAQLWRRASIEAARLAALTGARYLHLLQPNQWYWETDEYKPIAPDHPFGWVIEPVNRGYDALRREGDALKAAGVAFHDLSLLFRDLSARDVYIDDCCHYTPMGYHIIFYATAQAVAAQYRDTGGRN